MNAIWKKKRYRMRWWSALFALQVVALNAQAARSNEARPPNIIMFCMDDLNDWVGPLGDEQAVTPNLDRLAKAGITYLNAHAPGVFCAPSRTAIWTGLQASTTGCYGIEVYHYDRPELVPLQVAFKRAGYRTFGAGKLFHHRSGYVDARGWDAYFSRSRETREMGREMNGYHMKDVPLPDPYPYSPYYTRTDREISSAGHLEWGPIANELEEDMVDTLRTSWICERIEEERDEPFFMALGLYTPHYPNYAPRKYFDLYDRDEITLPPYKKDDLDDLSAPVKKFYTGRSRQHQELERYDAVKDAVHGYLASISYADAMLGRVMDALENSPHKENTIIVVWSDQGFHHGEKGHWGKHTLWRQTTRVPFIWSGKGIAENETVEETVGLIDLYPTFEKLCGLSAERSLDGTSLADSLRDPATTPERDVYIPYSEPEAYAVVNKDWRYIRRADGAEELYDLKKDPNEWNNIASHPEHRSLMDALSRNAPAEFAPMGTPRNSLELVVEGDAFYWRKR